MRISVMFAAAAVAMVLAAGASAPARADAKGEFQKGCEAGHGSYGEDVNGVFCNSSGGVHIACDSGITHCTASSAVTKFPVTVRPRVGQLSNSLVVGVAPTAPLGPKFGVRTFAPPASLGGSPGTSSLGATGGPASLGVAEGAGRVHAMHLR
jgi:hypothetical protein